MPSSQSSTPCGRCKVLRDQLYTAGDDRDRYHKALEHIVEAAEHPSPTINTSKYLGHVARTALEGESR